MNFGLRLDEIVDDLVEGCEDGSNTLGYRYDLGSKAKQALTSLIKELVAEAKPEVKAHPLGPVTLADCQRGLDHYEANLLKALEEV
jgi:hypothetical protein